MQEDPLRQIFYHSRAVGPVDTSGILASSKRNNGIDGITGVLLADGRAYLQVIEGPESGVLAAFDRISADPRHDNIVIISNHLIDEREFAYWSMELREPRQASDDAIWRLRRRLMDFDPDLHHYFFDSVTSGQQD